MKLQDFITDLYRYTPDDLNILAKCYGIALNIPIQRLLTKIAINIVEDHNSADMMSEELVYEDETIKIFEQDSEDYKQFIVIPKRPSYPEESYKLIFEENCFTDLNDKFFKLQDLLQKYPAIKVLQKYVEPEIKRAILFADRKKVSTLLERGLDPNILVDKEPILNIAARNGNLEIVKLLVDAGANLNRKTKGSTALMWAAESGNVDLVKLLLNKGANPLAKSSYTGTTVLMKAVEGGNIDIVKLLLEKGANPRAVDKEQRTPLMYVAATDDLNIVRLLLEKGADPFSLDEEGFPALSIAIENKNDEMVQLMLEYVPTKVIIDGINKFLKRWETDPHLSTPWRVALESKLAKATGDERVALMKIKDIAFYRSGRPKTEMTFINKINTFTKPYEIQEVSGLTSNPIIADIKIGAYGPLLIPVLRYASGMYGTYYIHEKKTQQFCGTFYYFDNDSPFLLYSVKTLVAISKPHAFYMITGNILDKLQPAAAKLARPMAHGNWAELPFDENGIDKTSNKYAEYMYAAEDNFDQPLCEAARGKYDCIILLRMFGSTRMVTEVLDTRDREISFKNIYQRLKYF